MNKEYFQKLILNIVNFYTIFNIEFTDLIPDLSNSEISPLLSKILNVIHLEGTTTSSKLSKRLNIPISNISRSVNTLNNLGYLIKKQDSKDKRIVYLSLSPKALEFISTILTESEETFLERFNVLSLEEIVTISMSLATLKGLFIKMRDLNLNKKSDI
ncbi:MarR family winged helix-turn-helix transcriptional regulator [Clostridium saccharobutylicum]|uniref:MarR family winged helix-turn-helix transcriptional regulator n=1 Tax=Clostridium saccharobutylicum TaxID=169679 RepID=UPI0015703409|nr:winged helix DNA-binding protein [Clostridium saccharobutylicum]NSC02684.1 DNA-binding MarR family transcriptional regulator [Clostridium saccharobutylicum]